MTPFSLMRQLCGLSQREAATVLKTRMDTVKSWDNGRRTCPGTVIEDLRRLARRQERAAAEALAMVREECPPMVELGYATDDSEAQSLGWPCAGAQSAALARIIAGLPDGVCVEMTPRGSTPGTAAGDLTAT